MTSTLARIRLAVHRARTAAEAGMSTAEYAIGTIAAASFAALLIAVLKDGSVKTLLLKVITQAFGAAN